MTKKNKVCYISVYKGGGASVAVADKARSCLPNLPRSRPTNKRRKEMNFVSVGFGNVVNQSRIVEVKPLRRGNLMEVEKLAIVRGLGLVLDLTEGRKTRSIIVMDSGHHILAAPSPEELKERI